MRPQESGGAQLSRLHVHAGLRNATSRALPLARDAGKCEIKKYKLVDESLQLEPQLLARAGTTTVSANINSYCNSLQLAPPPLLSSPSTPQRCLFKPTHCAANWVTFRCENRHLETRTQQQQQIKTTVSLRHCKECQPQEKVTLSK